MSEFDLFLEKIRSLTHDVFIPLEPQMEAEGDVPAEAMAAIRDSGLFAISIPQAYGGLQWSQEQQVRLTFEFTYASSVYRSIFSTTIGLCSQVILDFGTEDQKQQYLPAIAGKYCCF